VVDPTCCPLANATRDDWGNKQFELVLDKVWVAETALLPAVSAVRDATFQRATVFKATETGGGSQKAVERTVEYPSSVPPSAGREDSANDVFRFATVEVHHLFAGVA
jgi:hypothetical protein